MTTKVPWRAHWKRRCWRKSARSLGTAAEVEMAAKAAEEEAVEKASSNPWWQRLGRNSDKLVRSPPLSDAPSMWVVVAPPDVVGLPHQPTYS
uniref:Uncharacterized protein n=1 Tax=Oryza nivara TaxID=4536 RepID=A0A0E0INR4_ORYNI